MKRIFTLLALLCAFMAAHAQIPGGGGSSITGKISGTVVDSVTKKPLDYATISIFRSGGKAPLNGVLTDEKGKFSLNNIAPGKYKIAVSFIGYPTKVIDPVETTPGKPDNNMGTVVIAPSSRALKEVVVAGQASLVENRIDKIVYNAEKDLTSAGGNATDVLRKVPLLSVDMDGNVSLRGDQNVRVLINGKPSGALSTSLADVLRTIPADQIKSIEVITSPSAKYDAEGSGGIINIITKSSSASGVSGSVSGGIGTRQNNGNANLNYRKNRLSLTANVGTNFAWPQTSLVDFNSFNSRAVLRDKSVGNLTRTQHTESETKRFGTIGSVNGSYDFNEYNSITSTIRVNGGGFKTNGTTNNYNSNYDLQNFISGNGSKASFGGFDWNADYTRKFKKKGEELTFAGQWSHSTVTSDYYSTYFALTTLDDIKASPNQKGNNDGKNDEYTLQVDYALPIGEKIKFEAGGKSIFRRLNSVYDVFRQPNNMGGDENYFLNDTASNKYNYNQDVYAGYTVWTFTLPKSYSLQVGARVENTQIKGDPRNNTQQSLEPFSNSYTTFIPSFILSKSLKGGNTLKLTYSKRIQRPSLQYLNPFINKGNPDNQTQGNPSLSPEITQTVELGYTAFIKSSVISFSTYYKRTSNLIEGILTYINDPDLQDRSVTRTNYLNIGNNKSFGASTFGSFSPFKALTIRGSANVYTYSPTSFGSLSQQQTSNDTYIQYNIFSGASLTLPKGFSAEAFGVFNSPRRSIQGTNPAFNIYGFGVKKDIIAKKFTLGLNVLQPSSKYLRLNSDINGPSFKQTQKISYPIRSFGLTFSYNFGKITYGQQTKKKGVNNDDLLQGGDQSGMGGSPQGGGGSPRQ
ncbi:outer membrane beta-barrel family protein [Mucilaginibacter lacusdianchii]|uniref:outer membrane beta-barrel family protein n=1 Tax=Mucilaginibacter lacusdianchii TaxID=2684211 RepID=UPI00131E6715|nr:outer membrane beta-barrel family protein [Mucilaginibacter sp. JXJ CY 39]